MKNLKANYLVIASLFTITFTSIVQADTTFNITENTKINEIKSELGMPVRSLIGEKKNADFLDPNKYTFLDSYNNTFGVVVSGVHPVSYRLSKNLDDGKNADFFKIISNKSEVTTTVSVFGVKLGMNFNQAEQLIYQLATFDKSITAQNGRGIEYQLTNGARVVLLSDADNNVSDAELFLN
jgi:hypothetical protein